MKLGDMVRMVDAKDKANQAVKNRLKFDTSISDIEKVQQHLGVEETQSADYKKPVREDYGPENPYEIGSGQ